jgi:hypothetical protein
MMNQRVAAMALSWVLAVWSPMIFAAPRSLECRMSLPSAPKLTDALRLNVQLRNTSDKTLWLLVWNTPWEGLKNQYLQVIGPGGELPYEGPVFKRMPPSPSDYRRIDPGQVWQTDIDLRLAYTLTRAGTYKVSWPQEIMDHSVGNSPPAHSASRAWVPLVHGCRPVEMQLRR